MDIAAFNIFSAEIRAKHRRGMGGEVEGFALDCHYLLDQSPLLNVGNIKKPGESDSMLTVRCTVGVSNIDTAIIGAALQHFWETELSYPSLNPYRSASAIVESVDEVALYFIMVRQEDGPYVTGKIVVDMHPKQTPRRTVRRAKKARH